MSPENRAVKLKRILVPLDASPHSLAALRAAVRLAAVLDAEIDGLYVEDAELLEVCRYPFAREVARFPSPRRRLEAEDIERDFRLQARRIQETLAGLVHETGLTWRFTVRRGRVAAEILAQAPQADLVVMGRVGRTLTGAKIGSTVRRLIEARRGMALLLREGLELFSPVVTVYNGSELSGRAVETAWHIAAAAGGELEVLIPTQTEKEFAGLRDEVLSRFGKDPASEGRILRFRRIRTNVAAALVTVLRSEYRQPVVLPVDAINGDADDIQRLINRIDNPVLIVQ